MTVCVAARGSEYLVCAFDRMITAGPSNTQVEYESGNLKIVPVGDWSAVILVSGENALQAEIIPSVERDVHLRKASGDTEISIDEIVKLYAKSYQARKGWLAELEYLEPLGLNIQKLQKKLGAKKGTVAWALHEKILEYEMPDVEVIIAGIDSSGHHIHMVTNGRPSCHDFDGFAAIGLGAEHALLQFRLAGHARIESLPETLLRTYIAKRRAEIAPGVGPQTDMVVLGPQTGAAKSVPYDVVTKLEATYQSVVRQERDMLREAALTISRML